MVQRGISHRLTILTIMEFPLFELIALSSITVLQLFLLELWLIKKKPKEEHKYFINGGTAQSGESSPSLRHSHPSKDMGHIDLDYQSKMYIENVDSSTIVSTQEEGKVSTKVDKLRELKNRRR